MILRPKPVREALGRMLFASRFGLLILPAVLLIALALGCYSALNRLSRDETAQIELLPTGNVSYLITTGMLGLAGVLAICAFILQRDAEKRCKTDAALRESEDHYRHTVELSPQIHWTANIQGQIIELNERWYALTGLSRDGRPSQAFMDACHPEDRALTAEAWKFALATGSPLDIERRIQSVDGGYRWMRTRAFPRRVPGKGIVKWYGTTEDITDRKQAEIELLQSRESLERVIEERTQKLVQSNRDLESANKELETFAYTSSHDLRAPARNIDSLAQILFEDHRAELTPPVEDYIHRMQVASQRMGHLIDDLLFFSRTVRENIDPSTVDLSQLATRIVEEFRLREPNRDVGTYIQAGLTAWGSERLLAIVLENLIANAWKYTSKTKNARVEFRRTTERAYVVADNGAGFDMRYAGLLFAPFQRLHKEEDFPGTGIGLATAQRIIRRHGGHISAESEPGKGATFRFTLPEHPEENTENACQTFTVARGRQP